MPHTILDDDKTDVIEERNTPITDSSQQGGAKEGVIPVPVILSVVAILIALGSCVWVTYHDFWGSGIDQYDLSTPKAALISSMEIDLNGDMLASFELTQLTLGADKAKERIETLKVHQEREWCGNKILFISYDEDGIQRYQTKAFSKNAETGLWIPNFTAEWDARRSGKLGAMMEAWGGDGEGNPLFQ